MWYPTLSVTQEARKNDEFGGFSGRVSVRLENTGLVLMRSEMTSLALPGLVLDW